MWTLLLFTKANNFQSLQKEVKRIVFWEDIHTISILGKGEIA